MSDKIPAPTVIRSTIPAQILGMDGIGLGAKVVFGCIYALALDHARCFMSNETLGQRLNISGRQVKRLLKPLFDAKLIEATYRKGHRVEIRVIWQPGTVIIGKRTKMSRRDKNVQARSAPGGQICPDRGTDMSRPRDGYVPGHSVLGHSESRENPSSAAREDAAAKALALELLGRGEELGLKGIAEGKVDDAVAMFGGHAVAKALDDAERHHAESWGYVVTILRRWKADDALPRPPKAKAKGNAQPPPSIVFQPPADDKPLEPGAATAMVAEMKRKLAGRAQP